MVQEHKGLLLRRLINGRPHLYDQLANLTSICESYGEKNKPASDSSMRRAYARHQNMHTDPHLPQKVLQS